MIVTLAFVLALVRAVPLIAGLGPGLLEVAKVATEVLALAEVAGLGVADVVTVVLASVAGLVPGLVEGTVIGLRGPWPCSPRWLGRAGRCCLSSPQPCLYLGT